MTAHVWLTVGLFAVSAHSFMKVGAWSVAARMTQGCAEQTDGMAR